MDDYDTEFLEFAFIDWSKSGKTEIWSVHSKLTGKLGVIKWYSQWRRYVFWPDHEGSLYDAKCLGELKEHIDRLMEERR